MSSKKKAAPTDDELGELFEGIDDASASKAKKAAATTTKPKPSSSTAATSNTTSSKPHSKTAAVPASKTAPSSSALKTSAAATDDNDILAELENQLESRPHTPRIKDPSSASSKPSLAKQAAGITSPDDKGAARKSTDSTRSLRASLAPSATGSDAQDEKKEVPMSPGSSSSGGAGGWWGGLLSTATAAMKTAEAAVKEIQQNEEAKKWAEQVRGNVGALSALGGELRQRAMPTFANILHTLAPPISSHERLRIHVTHDLVGYPSLDPLIHSVFGRVMSQVEGGDLLVVQRGHESRAVSSSSASAAGWRDGPWWREAGSPRGLGLVRGLAEGTKLCRAAAEGYAAEHFATHGGGLDAARARATEALSESNPVRTSDLFLAVQGIVVSAAEGGLFARTAAAEKEREKKAEGEGGGGDDDEVYLAVFVLDPVHEIEYATVGQAVPARWVRWLDIAMPSTPKVGESEKNRRRAGNAGNDGNEKNEDDEEDEDDEDDEDDDVEDDESDSSDERSAGTDGRPGGLPAEIRDIVVGGGVDPREWVAEWLEESLALAVGIVAQRYVARRMGVGEAYAHAAAELSIVRAKRRAEEIFHDGGGEAARAGLI